MDTKVEPPIVEPPVEQPPLQSGAPPGPPDPKKKMYEEKVG